MPNTFFENLFCGRIQKKLDSCINANTVISEEYDKLFNKTETLTVVNEGLKASLESWIKEADALKAQLEVLRDTAIIYPSIADHITNPLPYDVYDIVDTSQFRYVLAADYKYNTYTKEQWLEILGKVQPIAYDRYRSDVYDCDNFAEVLHSYVSVCFKDADSDRQGMLAIAWSNKHAYNIFVTKEVEFFIYEPQTGEVIGELFDEDLEELYNTKILLFIH